MLNIKTLYNTPNGQMLEVVSWGRTGMGDPLGVTLPSETGLWRLQSVGNPSRDLSGLMTPSVETNTSYVKDPNTGLYDEITSPKSMEMAPAYYDYYNLPFKAGWVAV